MQDDQERLKFAQWVLERNLGWIAAAEVKTGVIVTIDVAMLAGLAVTFGAASGRSTWAIFLSVGAVVSLVVALAFAASCLLPRTDGPNNSLVYFGKLAELSSADYADIMQRKTVAELLADLLDQIHRNATIAKTKHDLVRRAIGWSFFGAIPWLIAIVMLTKFT